MRGRNADEERAVAKCEKPVIRRAEREGGDAQGLGVRGGQREREGNVEFSPDLQFRPDTLDQFPHCRPNLFHHEEDRQS